jgi:hypothetical protein
MDDDDLFGGGAVKRARVLPEHERDKQEVLLLSQRVAESRTAPAGGGQAGGGSGAALQAEVERLRAELEDVKRLWRQSLGSAPLAGHASHFDFASDAAACAPLPPSRMLYSDVAEFVNIRRAMVLARVDLLSTTPTDTAATRLAELRHRGLTNDAIEAALVRRQALLQAKQGAEAMSPQRIQDGVLQLLRLLHRRQLAVLQGHLLPPPDSLFAQTPL